MLYEDSDRNQSKEDKILDHSCKGHVNISSMSEEDGEITDSLILQPPQRHIDQSHKYRDSPKHLHHKKSKRHKSKRSHDDRERHELRKQLRYSELDVQEKGRYYNEQMHYKENYKKIQHTNEQTHVEHNSEVYRRYKHAEGRFQNVSDELDGFMENISSRKLKKPHSNKYHSRSNEDYYNFDKSGIHREGKNSKESDTVDSVLQDDAEISVKETGNYSEDDQSSVETREDKLIKKKRAKVIDVTRKLSKLLDIDRYLRKKSKREKDGFSKLLYHQTDPVTISDNSENDVETDAESKSFRSVTSNDRKINSGCNESNKSTERLNQEERKENTRKWYEDSPEQSHFRFLEDYGDSDNHEPQEEINNLNDDDLPEDLPPYYPAIHGCRSANEFQLLNHVEEGTYGVVYRARDKQTNDIVALKRLKMEREKEGFPITSLREINTLLKGQHPNVVTVREIVVGTGFDKIYIVMDYVEHDLKSLMASMREKKQTFNISEVKCLLKQLLCAMAYLHDNWILHRDLKTSNLLLSHKGILKVGDFGLAREYGSPLKAYTSVVVTLWYRAPELLLCTKKYSTPIDMWSVGCVFAELLLMKPVFPGKSEVDQVNRIFKMLGTPDQEIWPDFNKLPAVQHMKFQQYPMSTLRSRFYVLSVIGLSLLQRLLTYDPSQRITAEKALEHPYFSETPLPVDPSMLSTWLTKDELKQQEVSGEYGQFIESNGGTNMFSLHGNVEAAVPENRPVMRDGFTLKF